MLRRPKHSKDEVVKVEEGKKGEGEERGEEGDGKG